MGEVIQFPLHRARTATEQPVSKAQVQLALGRSKRWVEQMQRDEGLPFSRDDQGRCRYLLSEVRDWLAERKEATA